MVTSHLDSNKQLESQVRQILTQLNTRPKGDLPSGIVVNPNNVAHVMAIVTKVAYPLVNMWLRSMIILIKI